MEPLWRTWVYKYIKCLGSLIWHACGLGDYKKILKAHVQSCPGFGKPLWHAMMERDIYGCALRVHCATPIYSNILLEEGPPLTAETFARAFPRHDSALGCTISWRLYSIQLKIRHRNKNWHKRNRGNSDRDNYDPRKRPCKQGEFWVESWKRRCLGLQFRKFRNPTLYTFVGRFVRQ